MNPERRRVDDGLSLIELIVVVVLIGILGTAVAMMFINSWRAQGDVTTTSQATNEGQLIGQNIERAVRNGVAMRVVGDRLDVHTEYVTSGDRRQCQSFWVDGGHLYMATAADGLPPSPKPWTSQVLPKTAPDKYFALNGITLTYSFDLKTDAAPVVIGGTAKLRRDSQGASDPCWSE